MSTIAPYVGDGSNREFDVTFDYRHRSSIYVRVDGVDVSFAFLSASRVQLETAPAVGSAVEVYRKTDVTAPEVVFQDGQVIRAAELNDAVAQPRDLAEENAAEASALAARAPLVAPGRTAPVLGDIAPGQVLANVDGVLEGVDAEFAANASAAVSAAQAVIAKSLAQAAASIAVTYGATKPYASWADLAAVAGAAGGMAVVFIDAGTHTDPVVGGTVSNSGLYSWSTAPAGWKRVGNTEAFNAAASAAAAEATAASLGGLSTAVRTLTAGLTTAGRNFDITDNDGRVIVGVAADGSLDLSAEFTKTLRTSAGIDPDPIKRLPRLGKSFVLTDYRGVMTMGQSNGSGADTAISTAQPYDSKMLNVLNTTLVPLVESDYESHNTAFASEVKARLLDEMRPWSASFAPVHIVNNNASSGTALSGIAKGSGPYAAAIADVTALVSISAAAGKSYREWALHFLHGETDANAGLAASTYSAGMIQLKNDWNTDVAALTGQTTRIPMFAVQVAYSQYGGYTSTPNSTIGQLSAAEADSEIFLIAPGYAFDFIDGLHYTAPDQRRIGAYFEKAHWRYFVQNRSPSTVRPLSVTRVDARTIDIKFFVPVAPLVFDLEGVWLPDKDLGFQVLHAGAEVPIRDVRIITPDTVRLRMSADVVAGDLVEYALKRQAQSYTGGQGAGRICGPRGNLRDSDTYRSTHHLDTKGDPLVLPNWCVAFSKAL